MSTIQSESNPDIRPLQEVEINAVSGGIIPLIIAAELFALGFMGGVVACNVANNSDWWEF
jgi:hypothetical protein